MNPETHLKAKACLSHLKAKAHLSLFIWTGFMKESDLQTISFTLKQIKAATNNFDSAKKIGEGGFGPVYKVYWPTFCP